MVEQEDVVQPNFITDDEGKVYCTRHTLFNKAMNHADEETPIFNLFGNPVPLSLSCGTCGHYFNDDCYFSAESIDKIERSRDHGQIICDFCGDRIHRSSIVYQKLYYEQNYGVKMPLICCGCYANLKNDNFLDQAQKKMLLLGGVTILSIVVFCYYFSLLFFLVEWGVFAILSGLIFWGYFSYNYARKIILTYRGKKYYEQLHAQLEKYEDRDAHL
ncbi:MAG TPA: hypothetical protein VKK79_09295 [Candidatus Lokiarchaeia archaeon]|nr:hypothetical protein [Candidatus Lokiarchaeia archaeon]